MAEITPREAVSYALSPGMLSLYALYVVGYLLFGVAGWLIVEWAWRGGLGNLAQLLAILLNLAGILIIIGATIGLAYKVIADATSRTLG